MSQVLRQTYLISRPFDLSFILLPPIFISAVLIILSFSGVGLSLSPILWLIFVVGIDVAHVYATLFKTYLDPIALRDRLPLLLLSPICAFLFGVFLYSQSSGLFWRVLAYMAVYHFIRQQYGFFRLYEKKEGESSLIGKLAIYSITFYPIVYWHLHLPRNFSWFVDGDFISISRYLGDYEMAFGEGAFLVFFVIQLLYVYSQISSLIKVGLVSVPKNLLYIGTFLAWYGGIVLCNGDLVFTLTNVVCHGIPYIALVWGYNVKRNTDWKYSGYKVIFYLLVLFSLAYFEEGLWDFFVWNEHYSLFLGYSSPIESKNILKYLVPLLTLPQLTHYILDAFIWRISKPQDQLEVLASS
jgi:hypothetical protein